MIDRDNKGRFISNHSESIDDKIKRMYALQESWKSRKDYIGDIRAKHPRIYNSWRSIMFTQKGKKAGISEEWKNFRTFYNDVVLSYQDGKVFRRLDATKPFSKDNFIWVTNEEAMLLKSNLITITYNNKTLYLKQWAEELNQSLYGIKNRYYKKDKYNYSTEEILFGRTKKRGKTKSKLFGPFPNVTSARKTVDLINRMYPLRKCNTLKKDLCLYYHINECLGYCKYDISEEKISSMVKEITEVLNGNYKEITKKLEEEMLKESENLNYEKALELKRMIEDIKITISKQIVVSNLKYNFDVFGYYVKDNYLSIETLFIRKGTVIVSI